MVQSSLFEEPTPAEVWDEDAAHRMLDGLFMATDQYRKSSKFLELMRFVGRFRFYSPFNALLVHIQMPEATFVAPAGRWWSLYRRRIKPDARPLVILQPMGPVMFVFDVSQTEPTHQSPPLPPEVEHPFEVEAGELRGGELERTMQNAARDGIRVSEHKAGAGSAGAIGAVRSDRLLLYQVRESPSIVYVQVPLRYEVLLNADHSPEAKYATLAHELAHLYCGHLGTLDESWWPDRIGASSELAEFEAEAVSYLLCARLGIKNPSAQYLALFVESNGEIPTISMDCVIKACGLIEQMGKKRLPARRESAKGGGGQARVS